eukprot:scaffold977_cov253-Pinguiococcus_pyrenoidosus.AAC.24
MLCCLRMEAGGVHHQPRFGSYAPVPLQAGRSYTSHPISSALRRFWAYPPSIQRPTGSSTTSIRGFLSSIAKAAGLSTPLRSLSRQKMSQRPPCALAWSLEMRDMLPPRENARDSSSPQSVFDLCSIRCFASLLQIYSGLRVGKRKH